MEGVTSTERLEKLSSNRKTHQDYLFELRQKQDELLETDEIATSLEEKLRLLKQSMKKAEPAVLKRLIRNLYDVIFLKEGRIEGFYVTTNRDDGSRQYSKNKKASGVLPEAFPQNSKNYLFPKWQPSGPTLAYWLDWWNLSPNLKTQVIPTLTSLNMRLTLI